MLAALTRILGMHNLALAEDVAQDVLCRALEVWKYHPPPENPSTWLLAAARNRAIDVIRAERTRMRFAPDLELASEYALLPTATALFRESEIGDDLLRMMFSVCFSEVTRTQTAGKSHRMAPETISTLSHTPERLDAEDITTWPWAWDQYWVWPRSSRN